MCDWAEAKKKRESGCCVVCLRQCCCCYCFWVCGKSSALYTHTHTHTQSEWQHGGCQYTLHVRHHNHCVAKNREANSLQCFRSSAELLLFTSCSKEFYRDHQLILSPFSKLNSNNKLITLNLILNALMAHQFSPSLQWSFLWGKKKCHHVWAGTDGATSISFFILLENSLVCLHVVGCSSHELPGFCTKQWKQVLGGRLPSWETARHHDWIVINEMDENKLLTTGNMNRAIHSPRSCSFFFFF